MKNYMELSLTYVFRTQLCINTGIVYMHRFYMFHSFSKFHRNVSNLKEVYSFFHTGCQNFVLMKILSEFVNIWSDVLCTYTYIRNASGSARDADALTLT